MDTFARAWQKYQSEYVNANAIAQLLHMSWPKICAMWTSMGYDVQRAVRRKYDGISGKGAYDKAHSSDKKGADK